MLLLGLSHVLFSLNLLAQNFEEFGASRIISEVRLRESGVIFRAKLVEHRLLCFRKRGKQVFSGD